MGPIGYLAIRFVLWLAAVIIALFPTLALSKVDVSLSIWGTIDSVNQAGAFRDLFFVVVPTSVLALATLTDYLATCFARASGPAQAACILALLLNVAALGSGLVGFVELPVGEHIVTAKQVDVYGTLILFAVGFSLVTEIGTSLASHRQHLQLTASLHSATRAEPS